MAIHTYRNLFEPCFDSKSFTCLYPLVGLKPNRDPQGLLYKWFIDSMVCFESESPKGTTAIYAVVHIWVKPRYPSEDPKSLKDRQSHRVVVLIPKKVPVHIKNHKASLSKSLKTTKISETH